MALYTKGDTVRVKTKEQFKTMFPDLFEYVGAKFRLCIKGCWFQTEMNVHCGKEYKVVGTWWDREKPYYSLDGGGGWSFTEEFLDNITPKGNRRY